MADLTYKSIVQLKDMLTKGTTTVSEVVDYYFKQIEKYKHKNAVIEVFEDAKEQALEWDKKIASGEKLPVLAGIPILIKDNIMYKGKISSCASAFVLVGLYSCMLSLPLVYHPWNIITTFALFRSIDKSQLLRNAFFYFVFS